MKTIYGVYPFIHRDSIPKSGSIEQFIIDHSYLFVGWSRSPVTVRRYMAFLDGLFDNAITNLGYYAREFTVPDDFVYESDGMFTYIKNKYNITFRSYNKIKCIPVIMPYDDRPTEIFLIEYVSNDTMWHKNLFYNNTRNLSIWYVIKTCRYLAHTPKSEPIIRLIRRITVIISSVPIDAYEYKTLWYVYHLYERVMNHLK